MSNQDSVTSFTAADTFPVKVAQKAEACAGGQNIAPMHIQLCPTNRCNLNCSFCSCSKREKTDELTMSQIDGVLNASALHGCEAVTITGGGEPTLHPEINRIINNAYGMMSVGLVSNGISLDNLYPSTFEKLTWLRISVSDDRDVDKLLRDIEPLVDHSSVCDWAFSYVVTKDFDGGKAQKVIDFANDNDFSHVRLVSDLLDLDNVPDMEDVRSYLINDDKVIYQGRKEYTPGTKRCLISLLKPVIAPDGYIYPCCGAQYAIKDSTGYFPEEMRMGAVEDANEVFNYQKNFDGSVCDKCYYSEYNKFLSLLTSKVEHEEFV